MAYFEDQAHLYRVLDRLFERLAADPAIAEPLLAGRFVLRFRYSEPEGQVTVDLREPPVTWFFDDEGPEPDLEMFQRADVAHRFWLGQLSVPRALATRQVVSRGPVAKALKLLPAIKPAHPLYVEVLRELGEDRLLREAGQTPDGGPGERLGGRLGERLGGRLQGWSSQLRRGADRARREVGRRLGQRGVVAVVGHNRPQIPLRDEDAPAPGAPRYRDPGLPEEPAARRREMLARMHLIRAFETRLSEANAAGEVPTEAIHLSIGQEATAVGVCFALRPDDYLATTHRGHGHLLAKGADLDGMMAELLARATGLCGGKGGSMHVTDAAVGAIGANGIVGASPLVAAGAAHAARQRGSDQVAVAFLGDGATNQGMFHEALNFAAVLDLPALFVVENNRYGEFTPLERHCRVARLSDRAAAYGIPGVTVDGNDPEAVYEATGQAVARARAGRGPTLLECLTYRFHGHMEGDSVPYRDAAEVEAARRDDPLRRFGERLVGEGVLEEPAAQALAAAAEQRVTAAYGRARAAPEPELRAAYTDVFAPDPRPVHQAAEPPPGKREITCSQALFEALSEELARDEAVYLLGEDVTTGGYFAVTVGLSDRFGPDRVVDTPISEYAIAGSAVGAAMTGGRPVAEILFSDFLTTCMDPLVNNAAKLRYMSGGQYRMPLVVRTPGGAGLGMAAQHSQSLEALLTGVPGLLVVAPATPYDAKGLLKAAIRSDNPVLFFENKLLYTETGPVPEAGYLVPLGKADVKRSGTDVTVVSVGAALSKAVEAARQLAAEGVEVELVDVRSLVPLDLDTLLASVRRTGRLVTVEDGCLGHGFGAEIVARITEVAFSSLRAAPRRVAAADVPIPYASALENHVLPDPARLVEAVRATLRS
jgi:pyruvate/2-oxoglutarate/acetoin dehydrogenase E1 component/TPP-dependent pyruvate/acetoin dehydrogenase alpha subunit